MNPIDTAQHLVETYQRYLLTRFPIGKRNPERHQAFKTLLQSEQGQEHFIKGPILELTPPYEQGLSLSELAKEDSSWQILKSCFEKNQGYDIHRPLFKHQERALKTSLNHNLVVASGTGSGKTESFLFPIIRYCLENPGQGVRALIVYPLNALIEDQIQRLSEYLKGTSISFGKYSGQTPRDKKDKNYDKSEKRCPNHLITREEMRENPPNILITNYTMLEYMLLRPGDAPLLDICDQQAFKFIVLDEAHTYTGAQGTEVALLLKRLRHRVNRKANEIRYIATSATLGGEDLSFAKRLFGTDFGSESLIKGIRQNFNAIQAEKQTGVTVQTILEWGFPESVLDLQSLARKLQLDLTAKTSGKELAAYFQKLEPVNQIIQHLSEQPCLLRQLAENVFPNQPQAEAEQALIQLVAWADFIQSNENERILPVRYHMFISASKGFFVSLSANNQQIEWKQMALRQSDIQDEQAFELAVCRVCGEDYIIGSFISSEEGKRYKPITDSFFEQLDSQDKELEKVILHSDASLPESKKVSICTLCGRIDACEHSSKNYVKLYQYKAPFDTLFDNFIEDDQEDETQETEDLQPKNKGCIRCHSGRKLDETLVSCRLPNNGVTATLASALFDKCPAMPEDVLEQAQEKIEELCGSKAAPIIAKAKKLISFSDSRQQAAFFGAYLQVTHTSLLWRQKVYQVIQKHNQGETISLEEIVNQVSGHLNMKKNVTDTYPLKLKQLAPNLEEKNEFKNEIHSNLRPRIWRCLYELISQMGVSVSGFEGLGLGIVFAPETEKIARKLSKESSLKLTQNQIAALGHLILFHLRLRRALDLEPTDEITLVEDDDCYFDRPYTSHIRLDTENSLKKGINYTTLVSEKPNQLQRLFQKVLAQFTSQAITVEQSNDVLRRIAHSFTTDVFKSDTKGGYVINPRELSLALLNSKQGISEDIPGALQQFQACENCGRLSWIDLGGLCSYSNCHGTLTNSNISLQYSPDNHYREWLIGSKRDGLRSVEHTAQLNKSTAAQIYQKEFQRGRLNILSSSTTFEMGIDLGDLSVVFMRNVPPGIANYIQRAGRAGRRPGISPFVLTYCRNLPHDQFYFQRSTELINGQVNAPAIVLENAKILRRHMNAVVLSKFMQENSDKFTPTSSSNYLADPRLYHLFESNSESEFPAETLLTEHWLPSNIQKMTQTIKEIFISPELSSEFLESCLLEYEDFFTNDPNYGLKTVIAADYNDAKAFYELEMKVQTNDREKEYYQALIHQLQKTHIISHLAGRGFLPSYSFPHDVVPLKVLENKKTVKDIDLTRELNLAIGEYAPGSDIIANSKIYRSVALMKYPKQGFPKYYYYHCQSCEFFIVNEDKKSVYEQKELHMEHCSDRKTQINEKVKIGLYPKWGFSTLKGETGKFIRSNTQLKKAGSLSDFHIPEDSKERAKNSLQFSFNSKMNFELEYVSGYQMYRINQGAFNPAMNFKTEFRICLNCGAACKTTGKQSPKEEKHLNPFNGKNCPGSTSQALPSSLISIFDTDIVKLNFKDLPAYRYTNQTNDFEYRSFWRTLLYALLESMSHIMNIERNDLNGKVHYNINKMPTLILMDTVAGGAGHVARLIGRGGEDPQQLLNDIMAEAIHILDCQDCPEDAACYSCLFHHSNQKYHHSLNRNLVRDSLLNLIKQS